ncbi:hypothetical protein ALQ19_200101 [Pseudomonas syringae pv. berberidis]|nr:hypothetical protein ALQ19_200101 [Pseudomonas syringae pv. berberidis]
MHSRLFQKPVLMISLRFFRQTLVYHPSIQCSGIGEKIRALQQVSVNLCPESG